ncbi:MAG: 30S ribosomal protein S8 [Puniceicoccales bacterium]|jgi:small subunit ribosomal protein S8|nr:30S ribosomal protein S8 [Puniceicoccales bacterium]
MDTVSDFISMVRNGSSAEKKYCFARWSSLLEGIARVLKDGGMIKNFEKISNGCNKFSLRIDLKYVNGVPAITEIHAVSTPGCRRYCGIRKIPNILGGMGLVVISTSHGILSGFEANKQGVGGELLCYAW